MKRFYKRLFKSKKPSPDSIHGPGQVILTSKFVTSTTNLTQLIPDGPNVPTIKPRQRYAGAQNVDTVKDGDAMRSV